MSDSTPRTPNPLREALRRLHNDMLAYGGHTSVCLIREKIKTRTGTMLHPHDCSCGFLAAFEKAEAALAATPQPEPAGLDVELVALALHLVEDPHLEGISLRQREKAQRFAAEIARLAAQPKAKP